MLREARESYVRGLEERGFLPGKLYSRRKVFKLCNGWCKQGGIHVFGSFAGRRSSSISSIEVD